MGRKIVVSVTIVALAFFAFVSVLPKPVISHHQGRVLGESTSSSQIAFPPVTSGAGFILPDSPLFFLDKVFQEVRLLVAFTPERRVKVREQIAGERLAELRIMFARNNPDGVAIALSNLTEEANQMAATLTDAAASGRNVKTLAKELNETIKTHRKILNILADQTKGVLKLQLKVAREALKTAKIEIEDELTEDELENEIEEDLHDEFEEEIEEASSSAKRLEHAIDVLIRNASEAAIKQQRRREEALRHAIEVKNEALRKQQERLLEKEKKKQENLLKAHERAAKALREVQEAVERVEEAQETVIEIQREEVSENSGSGGINRSSSLSGFDSDTSGSSGSGSLRSGSSGSGRQGSGESDNDDND